MALRGGKAARDHLFCCHIHCDFNKVRKEASHRVSAIAGCPARGLCLPPALKGAGSLLPPQHIFQSSSPSPPPPTPGPAACPHCGSSAVSQLATHRWFFTLGKKNPSMEIS